MEPPDLEAHDDDTRLSPAGEVFAEFLALVEDGEAPDIEDTCARHPQLAADLRALHERWVEFVAPMGGDGAAGERPPVDARADHGHGHAHGDLLADLRAARTGPSRYADRGTVGRGGMGEVRAVYDRTLRRVSAMKVLLEGGGLEGSRGLARFLDEARISAQLDHPGIVPVHELGLDAEGRVYFTMPLIRGRDLGVIYALAREGDAEWTRARVLSVLSRVCEAVSFAHSRGVLHRDLKPANVMVGPFGETYVMDWGLAKVIGAGGDGADADESGAELPAVATDRGSAAAEADDSTLLTGAGTVVGTPSYLAPEQASGAAVDERVDVYSIGAMLYELLAGRKPYESERSASPAQLLAALAGGPPTPLREFTDDVPPELEAICEHAMAWEAGDRYPDVAALGDDLRAFLEGRVVAVHETGALAELRKWVARNRATAVAAAAAVLLALVGSVGVGVSEASRREQVETKNRELELARAEEARQAAIARTRTAEVLRLSDLGRLDALEEDADAMWPLDPSLASELDRWLADARVLIGRGAAQHRPTLEALRAAALPYTAEDRAADEASQEGYAERKWFRASMDERVAELEEFYEKRAAGDDSDAMRARIELWEESVATFEKRLAPLEALPFRRRTWRFETAEEQWEHDTLAALVDRLDALAAPGGLLEDVEHRRSELDRLVRETLEGRAARAAWEEAVGAIAEGFPTSAYAGLRLEPQFGLLPIGFDPHSELWEFAHLASGEAPERDPATGELALTEASGVVLVLVPGGRRILGAQAGGAAQIHYDPNAARNELPVHTVELETYFLSKYELTQAQWIRARGSNPADLRPGRFVTDTGVGEDTTLLHPVETVAWSESVETLRRLGLTLPTEAQWEAAARAGTGTPWYTGARFESVEGHVNAADRSLFEAGQLPDGGVWVEWLDDGRAFHAPVGSYAPNPWGLHDVLGNVAEWCLDDYSPYSNPPRAGDGKRSIPFPTDRVVRGGGFTDGALFMRVSARDNLHGDPSNGGIGVRPARSVE